MNRYSVLLWTCILTFLVIPWLLATIFAWVYAGGYETQNRSEEDTSPRLGYVTAIMQSSSVIIYLVFTLGGLVCMGIVGRPDDLWTYCCLVLGVPVFFTIPVASAILLLVSALNNVGSTGRNIGITATILCFSSTLPCCCILICALVCGTRGKGKKSRYPTPIAYIPVLGELKQREDKWEAMKRRREFTDDYPASSPPGPVPDYKAAKSRTNDSKNGDTRKSSISRLKESDGHRESRPSTSVARIDANRKSSAGASSTVKEDSNQKLATGSESVSKTVTEEDSSQRLFSLSAFFNPWRKSAASSQERNDKEARRNSEPAIKNGLSKEKSQQVKTESNPKPNSRVDSVAKSPIMGSHDTVTVSNATAPAKKNEGGGGKRSMFSKLHRKSDTNV